MAVSKSSKLSRRSNHGWLRLLLCFVASSAVMAIAVAYFYRLGGIVMWNDAEAHLNIARRVIDSRTPGWAQLGTTWLPLPHLAMLPLVRNDWLWRTGLAGGITSGVCTVIGAMFLFAAARRVFSSDAAAAASTAVFLLNPNALYLGSIPMTEAVFFACLFGLLYFTVLFRDTASWGAVTGAGIAASLGALTRYEAWFLLPFAAGYILLTAPKQSWSKALVFSALAATGPALWLLHNWWYFEDALYFYRGPYSALAIQGSAPYPGRGDWLLAAKYFFDAGKLVVGIPALAIGAAGLVAAVARRTIWPAIFLALPPLFYVWSIHSSGTPIHIPNLPPHGWYNTRYALSLLPLIALATGALARFHKALGAVLVLATLAPFLIHPTEPCITWQEADINSRGRRAWTAEAVAFFRSHAGPHDGFITSFNDLTGIYRTLGVPLRSTLTGDNQPDFMAATARPDLFLWKEWAVVMGGDPVQSLIDKARLHQPVYDLQTRIIVKDAPVIEIYRRHHANPLRQTARSQERLPAHYLSGRRNDRPPGCRNCNL